MCVFIFRRDLRIVDNTAWNEAVLWCRENGRKLVGVFVFHPDQIDPVKNKYFSNAAVQFMCESLIDLDGQLKALGSKGGLYMFQGDTTQVLDRLVEMDGDGVDAVFFNKDYSVYAEKRDAAVYAWCKKRGVTCNGTYEDYDLVNADEGLLADGRPYTNLSQYFAKFTKGHVTVREPHTESTAQGVLLTKPLKSAKGAKGAKGAKVVGVGDLGRYYEDMPNLAQRGGRKEGLKVISRIKAKAFAKYDKERDLPAVDGTTKASAHLHFGTISVREMYHSLVSAHSKDHALVRELVFRSFYIKIYTHEPRWQRGVAFREAFDKLVPWKSPKEAPKEWKAWVEGRTGFPLVDAGMRQLNETGWMHNRVRMLVAVVATRYLMLDWRDCARYFYTKLVDADTFSNTAGWQWAAGIGPDAVPYFRAPMNPFIQSKKFDVDAEYIKRWVPELADVEARKIHAWEKWSGAGSGSEAAAGTYPAPIIAQKEASKRAVDTFKGIASDLKK